MITPPRVRWLEFLFMPLVLAIMIVAWFNPAVVWFMRVTGPDRLAAVPAPMWMAGVILASTFVTRYVLTQKVKHPRLFIVGSGLTAIIVTAAVSYRGSSLMDYFRDLLDWGDTVSPEFVVLIAAAALWWRGILIGRSQSLVEENIERTFFNGIVALALLLYFSHFINYLATSDLLVAVLTFFAASLAALMVANIERARLLHNDPGFQFNRHWIGTLVGVIGAILLGAVALAGIFSPNTLRQFGDSLRPVISAVGGVMSSIIIFIVSLVWRLIEPLVPLLTTVVRALFDVLQRLLSWFNSLGINIDPNSMRAANNFLESPTFQTVVRGTLTGVVLIAFVVAVIWALYRSGWLARRNFDETRESIASRDLVIDQLKHLLNRLRRKHESGLGLYLPLGGDGPRQSVRRAYQEFLEWARVRMRARAPHQTPTMYAQRFGGLSEAQQELVNRLTALYLRARYAGEDITDAEAQSAQSAVVHLQESPVIQSPAADE